MSLLRLLPALFLAFFPFASASRPAAPELHGIFVTSTDCRFALVGSGGESYGWVRVGATVGDWKLEEYLPHDDAVVLSCGDERVTVRLGNSFVTDAPAAGTTSSRVSVTEVEELLTKMKFDALWDRTVEEQKKGIVSAMRQQATSELAKMGLPQLEIDMLLDRMGEVVVAGLQSDVMREDFARIYSEVYTREELQGMANFYDTAAGRAWAQKQPDVQQKLMQVMMPRVMQGMPAAQKVAADYLQQRAAAAGATPPRP